MAIVIQLQNLTGLYSKAAKLVGESQKAQKEIEQAERVQEQLRSIAASKEMAEFQNQLTLDRAKYNSMMDLEAEKRAKAWDIEKMELRSRMDFAEEERKRMERNKEYDMAIKQLYENPIYAKLTPDEKIQAEQILEMRKYTNQPVFPRMTEEDEITRLMKTAMGGTTTGGSLDKQIMNVISPDGRTAQIEAWEWPEAQRMGFRLATQPTQPKATASTGFKPSGGSVPFTGYAGLSRGI